VQFGKSAICRYRVEAGSIVVADGSAVLEMLLDGCVGMVLYDRSRSIAAAGLVRVAPEASAGLDLRERVDACNLTLLAELSRRGGSLDSLEIFALGSMFDSGGPASPPGPLAGSKVPLAYAPALVGAARRMEFDVSSGRVVLEHMSVSPAEGGPYAS